MASKVISTILNLRDNMSGGLLRVSDRVRNLDRDAQRASKQIVIMANNFKKKVDAMASTAAKLSITGAGIVAAFSLKTGLAEAMDLEGFRTQLETATKDTQRAGEVMKYAINLANSTPFEGGELVSAASSLEMFGLRAERWLPVLGDAAAGVNKSMEDVQSGFIKAASTGDFASLRDTLSITKEMVEEYSKVNFGKTFTNSKGQVEDAELLQNALEGLISERYGGGMEKLSKTTKGMWSTITGVTKNSLARIVGMQNDGTVKIGSLLDKIKIKIGSLADRFMQWQNDGTIDKISDIATNAFSKIFDTIEKLVAFILKNKDIFAKIGAGIAGLAVAAKTIAFIKTTLNGLKVVWGLLNGVIALSPVGLITLGIAALAMAFVAAYQKSEKFREFINNLWIKITEFGTKLKPMLIDKLKELSMWFGEKMVPKLKILGASLQTLQKNVIEKLKELWTWFNTNLKPILIEIGEKLMILWNNVLSPLASFMLDVFAVYFDAACVFIGNAFNTVIETIKGVIGGLLTAFSGILDFITGVFTGNWELAWQGICGVFSGIFEGIKAIFKGVINFLIDKINFFIDKLSWIPEKLSKVPGFEWAINFKIPKIPKFALGTQYFAGGLAMINERGGEIVNLPNGSKIIPADKSEKITDNYYNKNPTQNISNYYPKDNPIAQNKNTNNITINVNISGVDKDTKAIAKEVISQIVPSLKLAMVNTI